MKILPTNARDKPSQMFSQVVSQCDDNIQTLLPREENRKRTIRYQRPTPPVPAIYADVRLPEEYTTATSNQQFLLCDNGQNAENRMLVFYLPESSERLANTLTLFMFMDGTFSVARTHLNSCTPSGYHSKMYQALQYMRSCQINVKILTGNSSNLLLKTAMPTTYNSMSRL